jgi:hypothetical protein
MRAVILRRAPWILSLLLWTAVVHAAPDPREMSAREAFAAGRYQDALDLFVKLYAEKLHPNYLRNIARCYQNMGEPDRAIGSFREYLRKAHKVTAADRAEVDGYIAEMEQLKKTQVAAKQGGDAKDPGFKPAPAAPAPAPAPPPPQQVVIVEREVAPKSPPPPGIDLSAKPIPTSAPEAEPSSPVYARWWFWAIVGGVIAAGVGGAAAAGVVTPKVDGPCETGAVCK